MIPGWLLGVIISIVGSISSNLGLNVQKFSQNKEEERVAQGGKERECVLRAAREQ